MKQIIHRKKKWLLYIAALVLISLGSIYALRGVLIAPRLCLWLTEFIEAKLDLTVSIERIRGTYFTGITIESLTTKRPSSQGPVSRADFKKLAFRYSLLSLLGGFNNFLSNSTIDIQEANVTLDLDLFSNYSDLESNRPFQLPVGLPPAAGIPCIRVKSASLTLQKKHHSSVLNCIDLTVKKDGSEKARLELSVDDWRWHVDKVSQGSAPMTMIIVYDESELLIELLSVGEEGVKITANVGLTDLPQAVPFTLTSLIAGAPLEVEGHLRSDGLEARFRAQQLNVETLTTSNLFPSVPAKGFLSFVGKGRLPFNRPQQVEGEVRFDLRDGHMNGISAEGLHADVSVKDQSIQVHSLNLKTGKNQVAFNELIFPMSLLAGSNIKKPWVPLIASFQLDLQDVPAVLDMVGRDIPSEVGETPEHRLRLDGQIKDGGLVTAQGEFSLAGGTVHLKSSQFTLPTDGRSLLETAVDASAEIDIHDLGLFEKIFSIPPLGGQVQGEILIQGTFADPRGSMQVGGSALSYKGLSIGNVVAKIKADGRQIFAEKLNISSGNDLVNMSGTYRIDSKAFEKVDINFLVGDIQTYLHKWLDITSPFQGDLKGTISAKGPLHAPQGQLELASQKSQLGKFALSNTLLKASLQGRRLHIKQAKTHTPEGLLHFTGRVQADEAFMNFQGQVTDFLMHWKGHDLRLKSPARIQYSRSGTVDVSDLKLGGAFGELRLNGRLSLNRNSDFTFQVKHFSSKGWLTKLIRQNLEFDELEAQGTVQGTLASPKIDLIGRVRSLSSAYLPSPLFGQFQIAYSEDGLLIQQFDWAGEGGIFVKAKGALPILYTDKIILSDNTLSLEAEAQLMELKLLNLILKKELITGGSAHLKLGMSGTWENPLGTMNLKTKGMTFKIGQAPLPQGPSELEATLQYEEGEISLNTLKMIAPTMLITGKGTWQHCPTPKMLCSSSNRVLSGEIAFNGNAVVSDLSWLASRVPAIRRIGGRLDVVFNVQGPILKPSTAAHINLQDGELRLQMDFPTIKEIRLKATATSDEIAIKACSAQLGGETVFLQGSLSSVSSSNPFADMHIWGENLLLFRSQDLRLRANTDLTLRGPFQKLNLEGKVVVTEGRFSQYIDVIGGLQGGRVPQSGNGIRLFSIRKPPFSAMVLSVQITAENPFGIRNNFVRGELRPDLRLTGTGAAPILIGKVGVETARVRLPSGNLAIENGLVQFLETNPDRPVLNLIGNTRMLGYDISVIMEGPYDEPLITLTSSPPLPNEDLLMLVLTGKPPSASGRAVDKKARNLNVAVYVGRDLLDRWFRGENGSSTDSILDRFEAEIGRDITQQGEETLEARFRLFEGVFQEKDTLYITGERDIYDFYNAGLRIVFRFR